MTTTTDQPTLSADAVCPSWCAKRPRRDRRPPLGVRGGRPSAISIRQRRYPRAPGQASLDSRPRIYINGQPHTPDAADLVARAIIRLETHLHSPAVGAALDAGDVQGAAGAFLTQLEEGGLDA